MSVVFPPCQTASAKIPNVRLKEPARNATTERALDSDQQTKPQDWHGPGSCVTASVKEDTGDIY